MDRTIVIVAASNQETRPWNECGEAGFTEYVSYCPSKKSADGTPTQHDMMSEG